MIRKRFEKGFTLIELLVATAIVITCATVVMGILVASFRGSTKISNQEELRLAGESALTQAANIIGGAQTFVSTGNGSDPTADSTTVGNCTGVNSGSHRWVRVKLDGATRTIQCYDSDMQLDDQSLFPQTYVSVESCQIKCTQIGSSDPPVITLSVGLASSPDNADNPLPEQNSEIFSFSKTIKTKTP